MGIEDNQCNQRLEITIFMSMQTRKSEDNILERNECYRKWLNIYLSSYKGQTLVHDKVIMGGHVLKVKRYCYKWRWMYIESDDRREVGDVGEFGVILRIFQSYTWRIRKHIWNMKIYQMHSLAMLSSCMKIIHSSNQLSVNAVYNLQEFNKNRVSGSCGT